MVEPQIVVKPAFVVVGCEASFIHALSPDATNFEVLGPLWETVLRRAEEIPHRTGPEMVGVIHGRPEDERSHPDELQYVAGGAVQSTADIPAGMVAHRVDEGLFAVFTHRGPITELGHTVGGIYRTWLPQSNYEHAMTADVELYDERFKCGEEDDSEMEYWISVKPRTASGQ